MCQNAVRKVWIKYVTMFAVYVMCIGVNADLVKLCQKYWLLLLQHRRHFICSVLDSKRQNACSANFLSLLCKCVFEDSRNKIILYSVCFIFLQTLVEQEYKEFSRKLFKFKHEWNLVAKNWHLNQKFWEK